MQEFIRQIRASLNMSQEDFAKHLNVSFSTVNRWENGHAMPNKLAQGQIYSLCRQNSVPGFNMILQRIANIAGTLQTDSNRIILYHGSKSGIEGAIEPRSRRQCDFGKGFYMGTDPAQAMTLICDYEKAKFYIVSFDVTHLAKIEIPADIDWAMLVAYNRGRMEAISGTSLYRKYRDMAADKDLIIGSIANDRMFYVIDNFFIGNITDAALVHSLSALRLGKQYVAVSRKACDAVRIECEFEFSHLERLFIQEVSEGNRANGISLANTICKNYRREGLFFDEILNRATLEESEARDETSEKETEGGEQ